MSVELRDGSRIEGDLLIGADGLRSAVRAQMLADGEPAYLGCTAWRAITTPPATGLEAGWGVNWWGPGGEFGMLPMEDRLYWFATANAPLGQSAAPGDRIQDLLRRFGGWQPPIAAVIASTGPDDILRNDIFDRPPATHWIEGLVALLGDAAHPMAPNAGQGACQALEDAVALGAALAGGQAIEPGLVEYQRRRLKRANGLVRLSRQTSRAVQTESRFTGFARDLMLSLMPESLLLNQLDRTFAEEVPQ